MFTPDPSTRRLSILLDEGLCYHTLELEDVLGVVERVPLNDGVRLKAGVLRVRHESGALPGHPVLLIAGLVDVDKLLGGG